MKKNISILLAAVLTASIVVIPVSAENINVQPSADAVVSESAVTASTNINQDIKIVVNSTEIECDQPPVIVEGRTLVPLRAVTEAIGTSINWDSVNKSIEISSDELELKLTIGSESAELLNKSDNTTNVLTMDVPAQVINDRTMVPVRFIAEAFGTVVNWDESSRTVFIGEAEEDLVDLEETTSVEESTIAEETIEETTQATKIIKSTDSDYTLKTKKDNTITESVVVDDATVLTINASYSTIDNNSVYNEFLKSLVESDVENIKNILGKSLEKEYNNLDDDKKPSYKSTTVDYKAEVTYSDDKAVSTVITTNYSKNTLIYNYERKILITDTTGANNLTIEELTDGNVTTEELYELAKAKFNKLFEADKVHYYLDKVKNGGLENSMLKFYIENNGNFVFTADRGVVAPSSAGVISVVITPSEITKLYK